MNDFLVRRRGVARRVSYGNTNSRHHNTGIKKRASRCLLPIAQEIDGNGLVA